MNEQEAKELYFHSDCSYFIMCTKYYSGYIQYRQYGVPKEQEELWKNEKLLMLSEEIRKTGDWHIFDRMCGIAEGFRDYEKLRLLLDAYACIKWPLEPADSIYVAETILGRREVRVRSGLIFWAYDLNQRAIAIVLMDQALELIYFPNLTDVDLEKRILRARRLCKKIISVLKLNFSKQYLMHYYKF